MMTYDEWKLASPHEDRPELPDEGDRADDAHDFGFGGRPLPIVMRKCGLPPRLLDRADDARDREDDR